MKYIILIAFATLLFCLAIGFDISPYLRGPSPYPPEWRWPYLFVNTLGKTYLPLLFIVFILLIFFVGELKQELVRKHTRKFIFAVIVLSYFFQLSLLYFSRSGIAVLVHRIINPELNGYFTAALSIHDFSNFLRNYNTQMLHFVYHAKAHPPGAILLFYFINQIMSVFPVLGTVAGHFVPSHTDVRQVWNSLLPSQKAGALFAGFLIPFFSTLTLFPLYFSAKILYDEKVALRSICLFFFIPSIVFFIPINDAFLHVFSISSFFFLLKGLQNKSLLSFFLSGATLFLGVFFNLSLLPLLVFFVLFFLFALHMIQRHSGWSRIRIQELLSLTRITSEMKGGLFFILGFFLLPILLFFSFRFNFIEVARTIMKYVPDVHTRSYRIWIYYNLYDFFVFSGIPITTVFFIAIKNALNLHRRIDILFISFLLMLLILNFSGSVRGETGRLWSVYVPFMTLIVAAFATNRLKFSTKYFAVFLLLQALQILVMQEFWVMLW